MVGAVTVKPYPLSKPFMAGFELITLTRYKELVAVVKGTVYVPVLVTDVVAVACVAATVPKFTGDVAKLPEGFES